jgi:hypothetical protein
VVTAIERLAEEIRQANIEGLVAGRQVIVDHVGPQGIAMVYVPPTDPDEVVSAEELAESGRETEATFEALMPDFHQEDVRVTTEGDEIRLERALCGTRPGGLPFRVELRNDYLVEGGFVTRMRKFIAPETMAIIKASLAAGREHAAR